MLNRECWSVRAVAYLLIQSKIWIMDKTLEKTTNLYQRSYVTPVKLYLVHPCRQKVSKLDHCKLFRALKRSYVAFWSLISTIRLGKGWPWLNGVSWPVSFIKHCHFLSRKTADRENNKNNKALSLRNHLLLCPLNIDSGLAVSQNCYRNYLKAGLKQQLWLCLHL